MINTLHEGKKGILLVYDLNEVKPFTSENRKTKKTKVFYRMKDINASGLKKADIQHLLATPE
ncbi:MAG TPA: hypothetical protein VJ949_02850, partial [Cryomorphaceae bacterium]|nr:hypothetical protein [Cryomorphaceae bacterium]